MLEPSFVIESTLQVGAVYKMEASELIDTSVPHYFVVVGIIENENYLVLSTTQLNKRLAHFEKKGYDLNTLAYIAPNEENGLTENSYFNCNEYYTITKGKLIEKVKDGILKTEGRFSEEEYQLIVDAILLSEVNDIPKFLLRYD
jgi:hypothetical protein